MSSFSLPHYSKDSRELADKRKECKPLTPFDVMTVIYEVCENHLLTNNPTDLGFAFDQRYNVDKTKSQILLEISYDWKADAIQKRPAIFISRENAKVNSSLTIGQTIGHNVAESEETRTNLIDMDVKISTVATGIGLAEQFSEYVKYPFMYFAQEIEKEYGFHMFRLINISKPAVFTVDAKDSFIVELNIETRFYDTWQVKGDHLKLKTLAATAFLAPDQKPLGNQ